MTIRKGDLVIMIAGDNRDNKPHKVLRTMPSKGKMVVEGVLTYLMVLVVS